MGRIQIGSSHFPAAKAVIVTAMMATTTAATTAATAAAATAALGVFAGAATTTAVGGVGSDRRTVFKARAISVRRQVGVAGKPIH